MLYNNETCRCTTIASVALDTALIIRFRSPHDDWALNSFQELAVALTALCKHVQKNVDRKITLNGRIANLMKLLYGSFVGYK